MALTLKDYRSMSRQEKAAYFDVERDILELNSERLWDFLRQAEGITPGEVAEAIIVDGRNFPWEWVADTGAGDLIDRASRMANDWADPGFSNCFDLCDGRLYNTGHTVPDVVFEMCGGVISRDDEKALAEQLKSAGLNKHAINAIVAGAIAAEKAIRAAMFIHMTNPKPAVCAE